jgi:predicted transcriptional regulator of viral defense system
MSTPITDADRATAEKLLRDIWFECGRKPRDPHGGIEQVAQAIADARDAENRDCEALLRGRSAALRRESGNWISENDSLSAHEAMSDSIGFRRAADAIAARRGAP